MSVWIIIAGTSLFQKVVSTATNSYSEAIKAGSKRPGIVGAKRERFYRAEREREPAFHVAAQQPLFLTRSAVVQWLDNLERYVLTWASLGRATLFLLKA